MPATITPNKTDQERKRRLENHDNGSGRRPPNDKRTGGGGDNDNWNERSNSRRGPYERLHRYRMGIFFALASDLMFFVAIVGTFFVNQTAGHLNVYDHFVDAWVPTAIPPILWLNTAILLLSSVTMEIARRTMFRETDVMDEWLGLGKPITRRALPWLSTTIVLGLLFLAGQWIGWRQLASQHIFFKPSQSSHFFYLITGVHAVHLFLGIGALIAAFVGLYLSRQLESRQILVDGVAWYWHAMGVLWLFLFTLL